MVSRSRLRSVFMAMAIVLAFTICATYFMGQLVLRREQSISKILEINDRLQVTLSTLIDAETGQRGYLLTGDRSYLEPYTTASESIRHHLQRLASTAREGSIDPRDVEALDKLVAAKLAELQRTIELRQSNQPEAALEVVRSNHGKQLMDDARSIIDRLSAQKHQEFSAAQEDSRQLTHWRTAMFLLFGVLNLGFISWAYRRLRRETIGRETAMREVQRQKDLLGVTLGSIGDAVIVTDRDATITFMNPMAETLTGWSSTAATGKPCADIFRIVNESSQQPVESPVEKVLRLGAIVGLANHTLLIRKDGTEVPIDDSGAPIRDERGTIHGVVLVFRDFSEHKEAERKLKAANVELAEASRAKDQFLAALSHELRTPLTPVLATLTAWEAGSSLPPGLAPEMRSDIRMLRRNVELEARLIDDLLDLTRIVKGKLSLNLEHVDVHDLMRSVTEMFGSEIREKGIELKIRPASMQPHVNADPARIQQIFWNLLKNAAKFTPRGGTIDVTTANDNGELLVTFADTGIGMSADTLKRLFRPFEQGTQATIRQFGGLGMGLAIAKALVDAHGGSITATSAGEGRGAAFTIRLPVRHSAPHNHDGEAAREAAPPTQTGPAAPTHESSSEAAVTVAKSTQADTRNKLRILLVEDHADTSAVLSRLLRRWGHEVLTADSVAAARTTLDDAGGSVDLLLSDIGLPDGTGIQFIQWVREKFTMPAIALTGFGMDDDIERCKAAGFDGHLTKPVNFQTLEELIRAVTEGAR